MVIRTSPIDRRTALAVGGAAAVAAVATGCGDDSVPTTPASPAAGPLLALDEVPDAGSVVTDDVLIYRDGDQVRAHSAVCTHRGCTVQARTAEAVCPCHGSTFDAKTGEVVRGPATEPLPEVTVSVQGGDVVAG